MANERIVELINKVCDESDPEKKAAFVEELRQALDEHDSTNEDAAQKKTA